MERHRKTQESIAEEMMSIARSLKETSLAAKDIITSDNQVYTPQPVECSHCSLCSHVHCSAASVPLHCVGTEEDERTGRPEHCRCGDTNRACEGAQSRLPLGHHLPGSPRLLHVPGHGHVHPDRPQTPQLARRHCSSCVVFSVCIPLYDSIIATSAYICSC